MNYTGKSKYNGFYFVIVVLFIVYAVIWSYTGQWPWHNNPYNSYVLQARTWLSGRMDLGMDYSHLETASYMGKYYVSFPPLPSVLLLPFVILNIPDGFFALLVSLTGAFYAWKLCVENGVKNPELWAIFLMAGSNVLLVGINAWVWFLAQNVSFALTLMAIYYAQKKKGVISLALWSLAIGARPFQIVYLPLLLFLLYRDGRPRKPSHFLKIFIIPLAIGTCYMAYNYARFDSVFEFGHNYLPEFLEAEKGQFNASYIWENAVSLVRLPIVGEAGLEFPKFNGMNVFLCFPVIVFSLWYGIKNILKKDILISFATAIVLLLLILSHKTMGGFHFGNRYFIDVMPCFYYMLVSSKPKNEKIACALLIFGLLLNTAGIIEMMNM